MIDMPDRTTGTGPKQTKNMSLQHGVAVWYCRDLLPSLPPPPPWQNLGYCQPRFRLYWRTITLSYRVPP